MNNLRLLAGIAYAILLGDTLCAYGQSVVTLEEIFQSAEANSAQLRPSFTAQTEAEHEINVARTERLPDINASLSVSYIGDGFTTKRNYTGYQKAPIPHLGTAFSLNVNQPVYTGGAITNAIELAEMKSTAFRFDGYTSRKEIQVGQLIQPGQTLLDIVC